MITFWRFKILEDYPSRMICTDGSFYNSKNGRKLTLKPSRNGYLRVRLYNKGKEFYRWAHRMVAEAFISSVLGKHVHHVDKDVSNNNHRNLRVAEPDKHRKWHKQYKKYTPEELVNVPF